MTITTLEVLILAVGTCLFPFVVWIGEQVKRSLTEQKKQILSDVQLMINANHKELEDQLRQNQASISNIRIKLYHEQQVQNIKIDRLIKAIEE